MKRQLILGLVLVLLVIIAAGTYFFIDHFQQKQQQDAEQKAAALQLTSFNADNVTKLELHTTEQDYTIEIDDETKNWTVTNVKDLKINTYYITALCSYGSTLTAKEDLGTTDNETLAKYGLDDPVSITYDVDDTSYTVYVGKQTSTGEYFYMMKGGSDHVYLVDANVAGYLDVTETQLRYRYVVQDSTSDFCRIMLQNGDDIVYDLSMEDGSWVMMQPYQIPISLDSSKISSLVITIQQLEIDDFGDEGVTQADYAEYGFDDPGFVFEFEQVDGTKTTLLFEEYDPLVTSYVDCLNVETGEVLIFDSSYLSFLQADTDDYLMNTLYAPGIDTVTDMTIQYQGSYNDQTLDIETSFTIDSENATYACNGTDFSGSENAVAAFREFFNAASNLRYESIEKNAKEPIYTEEDVALRLTYTLHDETVHTVELVPYQENIYWAFIDGEFSRVTIRQKTLSNNGNLLDCYTTLMEAIASAES